MCCYSNLKKIVFTCYQVYNFNIKIVLVSTFLTLKINKIDNEQYYLINYFCVYIIYLSKIKIVKYKQ